MLYNLTKLNLTLYIPALSKKIMVLCSFWIYNLFETNKVIVVLKAILSVVELLFRILANL